MDKWNSEAANIGEDGDTYSSDQPPLTAHYLERAGLLVRNTENSYVTLEARDDAVINGLIDHSITYRFALGLHQGHQAFVLMQKENPRNLNYKRGP